MVKDGSGEEADKHEDKDENDDDVKPQLPQQSPK